MAYQLNRVLKLKHHCAESQSCLLGQEKVLLYCPQMEFMNIGVGHSGKNKQTNKQTKLFFFSLKTPISTKFGCTNNLLLQDY